MELWFFCCSGCRLPSSGSGGVEGRFLGILTCLVLVMRPSLCPSRNIIHGSDSVESAEKEIGLWFQPEELVEYKKYAQNWIYE